MHAFACFSNWGCFLICSITVLSGKSDLFSFVCECARVSSYSLFTMTQHNTNTPHQDHHTHDDDDDVRRNTIPQDQSPTKHTQNNLNHHNRIHETTTTTKNHGNDHQTHNDKLIRNIKQHQSPTTPRHPRATGLGPHGVSGSSRAAGVGGAGVNWCHVWPNAMRYKTTQNM